MASRLNACPTAPDDAQAAAEFAWSVPDGGVQASQLRPPFPGRHCVAVWARDGVGRLSAKPATRDRRPALNDTRPPGWRARAGGGAVAARPWRAPALASVATFGSQPQALRQVPVPVAEQLHRRRQQHAADDRRVDQHRDRQADAHLLELDRSTASRRSRTPRPSSRAALVTTPAVDLIPCATASSVDCAAVHRLPDPAEDEHVVVHREPEQHHEQEQRQP